MRIAIDARYLSHGLVGGVHTYTKNLVDGILTQDRLNQYVLWADTKAAFEIDPLPSNAELRTLPWHGALSSARNDRLIGQAMVRGGADLAHFPANFGSTPAWLPRVITLHDAINVLPLTEILRGHARNAKTLAMMTYLHAITRRSMMGNPTVITVSEYSKREILKHVRMDPDRVRVVHSAPDAVFQRSADDDIAEMRIRIGAREFVMLADGIKNPAATLRAYRSLRCDLRLRTSLVFFSRRAPGEDVLASSQAGESILLLRPSREDLVRLYSLADVFVFPSWYEGFGLPVLEAMACGAPVIASDRGSLPEVVGDAGIRVGAEDHRVIAASVTRILIDPDYAGRLRDASIARATHFSWEATVQGVLGVYDDVFRTAASPSQIARLAAV